MQVHDELVRRIFPGMALMSPEPFCAAELWSLLDLLPYRVRFEVYDAAQVQSQCPGALAATAALGDMHLTDMCATPA